MCMYSVQPLLPPLLLPFAAKISLELGVAIIDYMSVQKLFYLVQTSPAPAHNELEAPAALRPARLHPRHQAAHRGRQQDGLH